MFFFSLEKKGLQLHTLASFSIRGSMNMQISPFSTHSHEDPLADDHASNFKLTYEFAHGLS